MKLMRHRKFIHWIASLAILVSTLAPSISQALSLSKNGQGFTIEICSTNGEKITQTIGDEDSSSSTLMSDHCPYCVIQATYLLPTVGAFEFSAPESYGFTTRGNNQTIQISSSWVRLPSRAPPAKS